MKRYIKEIDGKKIIKTANQIIIVKNDMQTLNPSEDMILSDGWVEYVEPSFEYEPTEISINIIRQRKIMDIYNYDSSNDVNSFIFNGEQMWLDKNTRTGLMLRFAAEETTGALTTTLWYGAKEFTLNIIDAKLMLYAIENYASACYDNTQRHLANVESLVTKEDIENYDFKTGYPQKLIF